MAFLMSSAESSGRTFWKFVRSSQKRSDLSTRRQPIHRQRDGSVTSSCLFTGAFASPHLQLPIMHQRTPHLQNAFRTKILRHHPTTTKMAKAVTLTTLPNELLDAICARLNRSARCALALACKATNSSAIAALYQTYTNRSHPSEAPFYLFLRTICENPKHAALVKVVDIRGWRSELEVATNSAWRPMVTPPEEEDEDPVRSGPLFTSTDRPAGASKGATPASSAALFQLFLDISVKIGLVAMPASIDHIPALKSNAQMGTTLKQDADFIRQLKHGVEDSYFILMVAHLSQLEKLLIDGLTPYPILDWHHFFSRPSGCLQSLKILNLWASHIAKEERVVKTTLQILDILPNLEHLQLQGLSAQGHRHTADDSLPSKKLHIVVLYDCAVRHRLLKKIADGQNIRTFLYTMGKRQLSGNRGAIFSAEQIAGHLESSKHSLRGLTLCPLLQSAHPREYTVLIKREQS